MGIVDLRLDRQTWALDDWDRDGPRSRLEVALSVLWSITLLLVDAGLIVTTFLVAHWVRFVAGQAELTAPGLDYCLRLGLAVALINSVVLALHGMYQQEVPPAWPRRLNAIVSSLSTSLVMAVALTFFIGDQALSRVWIAMGWALSIAALVAWRVCAEQLYAALRATWARLPRVLIVGANRLGQELAGELARHFHVVGYVDNGSDLTEGVADYPLLGSIAELERVINTYAVDELVIALPASRREQVTRLITRGFRRQVTVKFLPGLDEVLPYRFELHSINGRRYIGFAPRATVSWLKRGIDLVLTAAALVVLAPLFVVVAVAIKLDSPGPLFYRQLRVGKDGRQFGMYKFRSMSVDADRRLEELKSFNEASGPLFKMRHDPRVTRVGRFVRRWSIDELPQLFNVLRGEMSLVGPRPPLPREVDEYEDWQFGRLRAVPGLTGLWQVSGRSEVPFHDMVRLDLHYIRNWSLGLDLEIMVRTIPAVLTNRGAY